MEKVLKLYYTEGGASGIPFPSEEGQIEIGAFRYDAKRMGGAPTITASVMYPSCLEEVWTDTVYAEFNGEKYYLKQTPTSSYSNDDARYKHDLELVSERVILDNVYFYDAVVGDVPVDDKPVSNSTKFVFWGDIYEFANRLKASLAYSGLDYDVVVDEEIVSEEKRVSFEDTFFSNAIQEAYNTYDVPYYFDGKTIHFGYTNSVPTMIFKYGVDDSLLSITKTNANFKIVNRATGTGSTDNIPFYYPNNSPKGEIEAVTSREDLAVTIVNDEDFANKVAIDGVIKYEAFSVYDVAVTADGEAYTSGAELYLNKIVGSASRTFDIAFTATNAGVFAVDLDYAISNVRNPIKGASLGDSIITCRFSVDLYKVRGEKATIAKSVESGTVEVPITASGSYVVRITMEFASRIDYNALTCNYSLSYSYDDGFTGWTYDGKEVSLGDLGLTISGTPVSGDTIAQVLIKKIKSTEVLAPSVYRESDGKERFYNAVNYPFEYTEGYELGYEEYILDGYVHNDAYKDDYGNYYVFENPYIEGKPKEHIITVDDLKPSIKETVNAAGLRMDMFSEFAYDDDDNDETVEDEEGNRDFVHSYFFAKLRKLDFNLFDHAIENQPMTISFTSGACGACNFEIGVTGEFPQLNPVQVNADGTLKRDENGRVICGQFAEISEDECQPEQQDTINHEVWIALKKEEDTYGILMPKAPTKDANGNEIGGHRPKACTSATANDGDTFVILGINLPQSYILNAEKKLEAEIIKYMKQNNDEKFTFSIAFSRIYFEENLDVLAFLNENSKIAIAYNNKTYNLYVSSFSYNMSEGDVLPEIRVELNETLAVSQNALQNAISQVKKELGVALGSIDVVGAASPYFLRKDADDEAQGRINFKKGVKFGEGGKVEILDNNSAKLTIEYLEVTKKASFTSLEIQEKTHVGGQLLVTPAAINCGEVEELDDAYRCYFQTKGEDGDEIFNQFAVGDQAICQTFNAWGSKYYWRLVTAIGEDYIDLSKTECDEESGVPSAGDKIIQLGNQTDAERQNAIVIAAYGDGSPYIIQYKGINAFEIPDDKIVTKLSSTENIFTGKVHMELGSDGLENIYGDINVGGHNLLRNSGFTGDYLSEDLADESVLDSASQMFNPPLIHWHYDDLPSTNAAVQDSDESASGKEVLLDNGSITQKLFYKTKADENYVLSFKAKGTSLTYSIGGVTKTVALESHWKRYSEKIKMLEDGATLSIFGAPCTLCEIQLEKGTVATAWSLSVLDNSSDRTYYESLKYLDIALGGATDVLGGLVLTNHIKVGNYSNTTEFIENGGMNGSYVDDNSPAFWAGSAFDVARLTALKYETTSTTPDGEASFVVTHGGKVIANDAIVRGTIYATNGEFNGVINVDAPNVSGRVSIDDDGLIYYGQKLDGSEYRRVSLGGTCEGASIVAITSDAYAPLFCTNAAVLAIGGEDSIAVYAYGDIVCTSGSLRVSEIKAMGTNITDALKITGDLELSGRTRGLRTDAKEITTTGSSSSPNVLSEYDFSVLIEATSGTYYIELPSDPIDGQEYWLETKGANLVISSYKKMWSHWDAAYERTHTFEDRGVIRFKYYYGANQWTYTWVESH